MGSLARVSSGSGIHHIMRYNFVDPSKVVAAKD